jgi:glycerol-3-phosphate acyltransferase PlsY
MAASVAGHMFSPWIGFKGGKGVATGFGALLAVWPALGIPALIALLLWAGTLAATRYMGFSSCVAAASLPLSVVACPFIYSGIGLGAPANSGPAGLDSFWPYLIVSAVLAALVIWKHRGNLRRMFEGRELRLGAGKSAPPTRA